LGTLQNLLLTRKSKDGEAIDVKIIDFGLSKAMEEPVASTFLGTRGYLAPEMLQRQVYTKAVDSWALGKTGACVTKPLIHSHCSFSSSSTPGVIVFVLLCGCLPFDDDSNAAPSEALLQKRFVLRFPRWAKNLSPSARDLLSHLLDLNPRTRYTAEQALDHPWVRGQTAPKGVLLASPGRIRKSPAAIKAVQGNRKFAVDPRNVVPGSSVMQRKNSL
jgi:serine/threonine protein kinase